MNVPIRMLGVVTVISWIILAAFIVSAAYSIKDLSFHVGEPQFSTSMNNDLTITLPLFIDNRGYYTIKDFNLTTVFSDNEGTEISHASSSAISIPSGQNISIFHNVTLRLKSMAEHASKYLFKDANLNCEVMAELAFAEIVPTKVSTNTTLPWGAPLANFKLGKPTLNTDDSNHIVATAPLSFENHALFDLHGNITVKLLNDKNILSEIQTTVNTPKGTSYSYNINFPIATSVSPATPWSGHFEVYVSTQMFDYGPMVIPFG